MGGKGNNAMELSTWTTGAGIAIGTDVDIGGFLTGAAATTLTVKSGADTLFVASADHMVTFAQPMGIEGAITGTSSGGSFAVLFRQRVV